MRTYERAAIEKILRLHRSLIKIDDEGVWLDEACRDYSGTTGLWWNYHADLDDPEGLDPETQPALRIPFTSRDLAAYMLGGVGVAVLEEYGEVGEGPDESALADLGDDMAKMPKQVLREAYAALREAQSAVGEFDASFDAEYLRIGKQLDIEEQVAGERERVNEPGISREEYWVRNDRARAACVALKAQLEEATRSVFAARAKWRKAMVNALFHGDTNTASGAAPVVVEDEQARQDRRLRDLRLAGGTLGKNGEGKFYVNNKVGAVDRVVAAEKAAQRLPNDAKSVRKDIAAAAEREEDEKRQGQPGPFQALLR